MTAGHLANPTPAEAAYREVACPLCDGKEWTLYVWAPSHYGPEKHRVTRCRDCGMIFTNPQLTTYTQQVKTRGTLDHHFRKSVIGKHRRTARFQLSLLSRLAAGRRILDFGCGNGALVREAIDAGWDALGVDLNEGLVEAANRYWKFKALRSAPLDVLLAQRLEPFDVVLSSQVVEHLQNPLRVGAALASLLLPGGLFFVDVPNASQPAEWISRGKTLDPTSHWNHFTLETLSKWMQRLGFRIEYLSAAPSLIEVYRLFTPTTACLALARMTKRILPSIGTGVCAIGRKGPP